MAKRPQQSGGKRPSFSAPAAQPAGKSSAAGRPGTPTKRPTSRQSVASMRTQKKGSNRTQLIIGAVAVTLMVVAVVVGLVLNRKANVVPADGYGASKLSTATLSDGVITVTHGSPTVTLDAYEDALCPDCANLEHQFEQQFAKAIDSGKLTLRYHMLNFLQAESASKTYSTRASAAMMCVAKDSGSVPGVFLAFHTALFAVGTQPAENGSTDLSNAQLAQLAVSKGASAAAASCINAGTYLDQATTTAAASAATLGALSSDGSYGTPTILQNGKPIDINPSDWLSNLVGS